MADDLEEMFKLISDDEAIKIAVEQEHRVRRARLNPGAALLKDGKLADAAYEVVAKVAVLILEGTIPIKTASQARDVAAVFHQIARLEAGKSTSNAELLTRDDREARIRELSEAAATRAEGLHLVKDTGTADG